VRGVCAHSHRSATIHSGHLLARHANIYRPWQDQPVMCVKFVICPGLSLVLQPYLQLGGAGCFPSRREIGCSPELPTAGNMGATADCRLPQPRSTPLGRLCGTDPGSAWITSAFAIPRHGARHDSRSGPSISQSLLRLVGDKARSLWIASLRAGGPRELQPSFAACDAPKSGVVALLTPVSGGLRDKTTATSNV